MKMLVNDLLETMDNDPYSNRMDVSQNQLLRTFSCIPTQTKVYDSNFIGHL